MTAQPNIAEFLNILIPASKQPVLMRPSVTDHFWGFEVRPNELVIDVAVLMRVLTALFAGATFITALGIWLIPSMALADTAFNLKLAYSIFMMLMTVLLARVAVRGTQVRVQFDTSVGEVREVVDGAFGGRLVLARYGLDAVEAVEVVESRENRGFGQVQIRLRGANAISAGDGAVSALAVLRNRIANDCGLELSGPVRGAVWRGSSAG